MTRSESASFDVVFYVPEIAPLLASEGGGVTGGAETQILLIARALAARGVKTCICTYDRPDVRIPQTVDGITIVLRPPYAKNGAIGRVREAASLVLTLTRLKTRVYVTRIAGYHVGLVALAARLRGRRFVYSSAHVADFDFRTLEPPRRDLILHKFGLASARSVVVQTDEQVVLAAACRRKPTLIRNFVEVAEEQRTAAEAFLWIGRAVWYKCPLAYVELARAVPEARFLAICAPGRGEDDLTAELEAAAADVPNLELLAPRPRRELMPLIARAVAVVNTSKFEGMPNATLEGWARGVPSLTLEHDPDGLIAGQGLGFFADGRWDDFVAGARRLWVERNDSAALSARCIDYVRTTHDEDVLAARWLDVLDLPLHRPAAMSAVAVGGR